MSAPLEEARTTLNTLLPEQVETVQVIHSTSGLEIRVVFSPSAPEPKSAEQRNRMIRAMEQHFAGRGEEDSDAWIQDIRSSRTFTKQKTYAF
jgi:hypothetical protein